MTKKILLSVVLAGLVIVVAAPTQSQAQMQMEGVQRQLDKTDQIIEQAKEAVRTVDAPMAVYSVEKAENLQLQAWDHFRKRRGLMAYEFSTKAEELARKALAICRLTEQGETVVLRRLERATEVMERARDAMPPGPDGRLRTIYDSARDNLLKAKEFYRAGSYRPALKLARQVEKAAREILEVANRKKHREAEFERRYEATGAVMERARETLGDCNSAAAVNLIEQAEQTYRQSHQHALKGRTEVALRNLQQARTMAVEAARKCQRSGTMEQQHERLTLEADHLAEQITSDNDAARRLLNNVHEQLQLAENAIGQQQTEATTAALRAARLMLNQLKSMLTGDGR
ncbi:MAG: hypothetical protein ABII79_03230 [bacterium]